MIETGASAPDVTLHMADGRAVALADLRGTALVLYFYPRDDTPGCTTEAQAFSAMLPAFADAGAAVIGVSKDDAAAHARFTRKRALTVSLASDLDGSVCEAFGVWVEKSMYGRTSMGIERATFLIDRSGQVARVWRKVKVARHVEAVLAAAQELSA